MKDHKVVSNEYTWIPLDKRVSLYGGSLSPRKAETRTPIFWLARDRDELYFVNASKDVLDFVIADGGGFETVDDEVVTVNNVDQYEYKNVKPNDAVKVEEYDGFYDLDYLLQVSIMVQSKNYGKLEIRSPAEKGGVDETVLLWDSGESGKNVYIKKP